MKQYAIEAEPVTRRFPYAIYFSIEGEIIVIVAVLSTARDPEEWQRRI